MLALGGREWRVPQVPLRRLSFLPPTKIDGSPDGQFIALGMDTLSLVRVATGEVIHFTPTVRGTDLYRAFSPDGQAIAYSRGASLVHRQLRVHASPRLGNILSSELHARDVRFFVGVAWLDSRSRTRRRRKHGRRCGVITYFCGDHRLRPLPVESVAAWY